MTEWYSWKRTLAILAILVLALIFVSFVCAVLPIGSQRTTASPTGTIFISGADDDQSPFLQTFAINVADGSQMRIGENDVSLGNFYAFSHDGQFVTFVGTTKSRIDAALAHQAAPGSVMQIYRAAINTPHTLPLPGDAEQISGSDNARKSDPAISDDGASVVYVAASSSMASTTAPVIHLVKSGSDTPLIAGAEPRWFSNSAFYYLAADGVRLFDTSSSQTTLVLPIKMQNNFKLAISSDRSLLAFSEPDASHVYFFRVLNDGLLLKPITTLDMRGFWVVFSPDSRFAAIQTASGDGTTLGHPGLAIVDMTTFKTVQTVSLDPLFNDRLFVTDWVK